MSAQNTTNTRGKTGGSNITGPGGPVIDPRRPKPLPKPSANYPKGGSHTGLPVTSKSLKPSIG